MSEILPQKFFNRPTLKPAQELLGKFLVRGMRGKTIEGMITEVEAYVGPEDKASHASRGKTKRTEVMFSQPGHWYVYMIYGMYYCLNVVTEKENYPAAILLRSISNINKPLRSYKNVYDEKPMEIKGPGRLCKYFKIDGSTWLTINKKSAAKKTGLWIEDRGIKISPSQIKRGKRIGVDYAGKWKHKPWRFYLKNYF